jgi:hypothetical protein
MHNCKTEAGTILKLFRFRKYKSKFNVNQTQKWDGTHYKQFQHSENFRSWCCHVGTSHHAKHVNIFTNFLTILQKCRIKYYDTLLYLLISIYHHRCPQIKKKNRSHLQILGTRQVIWSKSHTKNSQLWSDKWTLLQYGAICSVHNFGAGGNKTARTMLAILDASLQIYLTVWPDPLHLCTPVLVTGHTIMSKSSMTWEFITACISTQTYNTGLQHQKCTPFVTVLTSTAWCFMGTKQKYQDALYQTSCFT